jgi:type IV secretory pathway component VirB8
MTAAGLYFKPVYGDTIMQNIEINSLEDAGRTTAVWSADISEKPTRLESVAFALLPASVILVVAAVLLVALL